MESVLFNAPHSRQLTNVTFLQRNKSLLDAWDLIASKACHTRLPSFSRAGDLNRKQMNTEDNVGSLHCCFMNPSSPGAPEGDCPRSNTASRKSSRYSLGKTCQVLATRTTAANSKLPPGLSFSQVPFAARNS